MTDEERAWQRVGCCPEGSDCHACRRQVRDLVALLAEVRAEERDAARAEIARLRATLDMIVRSADDRTINNRPSGLVHVHRHWIDHARALLADTGGER